MRFVVQFSGGAGSYEAARRIIEREGRDGVVLLFADTLIESPDLYRFLVRAADVLMPGVASADVTCLVAQVDALPPLPRRHNPSFDAIMRERAALLASLANRVQFCWPNLAWISDGRTPWQVFRDERFIGNSRVDPCSRVLKRQLCDRWLRENAPDATIVLGLDWTETHRIAGAHRRFAAKGWEVEFPLNEQPWFDKRAVLSGLEAQGIDRSLLYRLGFSHDNCGGFCIKAGHGHFVRLLVELPEVYGHHEDEEQFTIAFLGRDDIAVLTDRRGGAKVPMTLRQFRERVQAATLVPDLFDIGGCGCFSEPEDAAP